MHLLGHRRQRGKLRASHTRGLVATGTCLVGTLVIVMGQKGLGGLLDLLPGTRPMHEAPTPARACDEISPHTGGGSGRCGGRRMGFTPPPAKKLTTAVRETPPERPPNKKGTFSE